MRLTLNFRFFYIVLIFLASATCAVETQAEVVVIVSAKSPIIKLSTDQTARIFLGKDDKFPNSQMAMPVDQPEGEDIRDEFYSKVVHKDPSQMSAYWSKQIFTGEGHLSKIVKNDNEVVRLISSNPNAIGYIDKDALNKNVRIVLTP